MPIFAEKEVKKAFVDFLYNGLELFFLAGIKALANIIYLSQVFSLGLRHYLSNCLHTILNPMFIAVHAIDSRKQQSSDLTIV